MTEPLTHIARPPLPWRDPRLTICGQPVAQYRAGLVMAYDDAPAVSRRLGRQRFALTHCMTCAGNWSHWSTWETDPRARLARELGYLGMTKTDAIVVAELRAIAVLIEEHRADFDALVEAHVSGGVVTMAQLRAKRAER